MEVVLVRDGNFLLTDLPTLSHQDVIDYFTIVQRDKEINTEQEEQWYQEALNQRR